MSSAPPALVRALLLALALFCPALARAQATGSVTGRVFDAESGQPIAGVSVVVASPGAADGGERRPEVRTTDEKGAYEFPAIPAGTYTIGFTKSGYRASNMTNFDVVAGQANRADFPMPKLPTATADQVLELDAFVVEASTVEDDMALLELRMDADQLLNTMSAEDLSRFAASDVADALKRVAGVNVVEGQFAVIRGLDDRYSSTLYNSAPVPSPDPDRQSVQLDLFPSDIVQNLSVSKSFAPDSTSNSAGGSINIVSHDYPEDFELKLSGGGGFETEALNRFLRLDDGSATGREAGPSDVIESDYGTSLGGRARLLDREVRFKALVNREIDYRSAEGVQEGREADISVFRRGSIVESGGLSLGDLDLSRGRFDLTQSERAEQLTGYGGLGFDLDESGNHRIDSSFFYTRKEEEIVQFRENGYIPRYDYGSLIETQRTNGDIGSASGFYSDRFGGPEWASYSAWIARDVREDTGGSPAAGPLWFSSFYDTSSFDRERDLEIYQINGDHRIDLLEGLHLSWAANYAKTTQDETVRGVQFFYEPLDTSTVPDMFPATVDTLGNGTYLYGGDRPINFLDNSISEDQKFARVDLDYERPIGENVVVSLRSGLWYENADRSVDANFVEDLGGSYTIGADSLEEFGFAVYPTTPDGILPGTRVTTNESSRDIKAWNLGGKATLWDRIDLLAGFRQEKIAIESLNDPFTGESTLDGSPTVFPSKYLFFDRLDNPARGEVGRPLPPGTRFNDEILGLTLPIDNPCPTSTDPGRVCVDLVDEASIRALANGKIDEKYLLPSFGIAVRPIEGLTLRGAYSKTVARPSFREMGYYVSLEPGSSDQIVGNPQLQLSEVKSWDLRLEYVWGSEGDLAAVSLFHKAIDDPIESIVVKNPIDPGSTSQFRTFFNNPNPATVRGVELEARKTLSFIPLEVLEFVSIGGNFTYIDAEVERTDAELARSTPFFGTAPGDRERFSRLEKKRRLFGQPEWIVNADVTFDHPDWGTKFTVVFFAISDILEAAGSGTIDAQGNALDFTLDRYIDSFYQLDVVFSQRLPLDRLPGDLVFKASAKNLTNSVRQRVYDPEQTTDRVEERSLHYGRDFSFSLSYTLPF